MVTKQLDHLSQLDDLDKEANERIKTYPASFEDYLGLPLNDKLTLAAAIYSAEVPVSAYREDKMPAEPFTFDITSLTDLTSGRVEAQVAFSEGLWTTAPRAQKPYFYKLPGLKIKVRTTNRGLMTTAPFAKLEISGYDPSNGNNLQAGKLSFGVIEKTSAAKLITDPANPLFVDTVKIIDRGVGLIYQEKITPRRNHLV